MKIYYSSSQHGLGDEPNSYEMRFSFENWRIVLGDKGSHSWGMGHNARSVFDMSPKKVYRVPLP